LVIVFCFRKGGFKLKALSTNQRKLTMTEHFGTTPAPAFYHTSSAHNNYGYDYGVSVKDRLHLSSDALNDALRDTVKDIGAVGLAVEKIGAATELTVEKTASAVALANALGFTNTQNLMINGFKDGRFDAATYSAAAALAACQNTAAIQAAIAECCCETKQLIREENDKTRDLISLLQNQNNAVALVDAKNEILALKLAAASDHSGKK
jgi:hypothetical protein